LGEESNFSWYHEGRRCCIYNIRSGSRYRCTPGVYNIPVKITGQNNYSTDNIIGLVVAGMTDFDISYVETLGSFSLNVANVGISPASAVAVNLPRQKNFSITEALLLCSVI